MAEQILTVSELTQSIKRLLEDGFPSVWVQGEISNYVIHSSGHRYFTLKDEQAQLRCVLWRGMSRYLFFEPEDGMMVKVCGQITVYERAGQYQMVVSAMRPIGVGVLEQAFQQLKNRLEREGLFDPERKRPLPRYPERIGVITSPTGAVIQDIITIIGQRAPWVELVIRPTVVQGEEAAADIAQAIDDFNGYGKVEIILLARGGGSLEDLWPFNEEVVARAIYHSRIPVVSAVGHETDFTIADFVADMRAPTPSAAAWSIVPDGNELRQYLRQFYQQLCHLQLTYLRRQREELLAIASRYGLRRPLELVHARGQRVDDLVMNLQRAFRYRLSEFKSALALLQIRLESASPRAILGRGYALVRHAITKVTISSVKQINLGDRVDITFAHGGADAEILGIRGED